MTKLQNMKTEEVEQESKLRSKENAAKQLKEDVAMLAASIKRAKKLGLSVSFINVRAESEERPFPRWIFPEDLIEMEVKITETRVF